MIIYPSFVLTKETKKHHATLLGTDGETEQLYYGIVDLKEGIVRWLKLDQEVEGE